MDPYSPTPDWLPPSLPLTLVPGQVHLWRAELNLPFDRLPGLSAVLSAQELAQAGRFYFERHRRRYIISHSFLRSVLAAYLGLLPQDIHYTFGEHGKPSLSPDILKNMGAPGVIPDLHFNLAHSHELALLGIAAASEIGVDIEYHRVVADYELIAAHFFSAHESAALLALPESQRETAFFNAWTRKEAYLKALGDGLARPLDSFDLSLAPGEPPRLLHVDNFPEEIDRWRILSFSPEPAYTAAIVIANIETSLSFWQWS